MRRPTVMALAFAATSAMAEEPPIESPQDAACRTEARNRVFTAPNPNNLSIWDLGSQIWHDCMADAHKRGPNPDRRQRRF